MNYRILVINTGSTSTKVSLFEGETEVLKAEVSHDPEELKALKDTDEQIRFRKKTIDEALACEGFDAADLDAVAARGGTFGCVKGGAYIIDEALKDACRHPATAHASNLSALLAAEYAGEAGCSAYIYDAVCTDEVEDIARYTGLKGIERRVFSHTLNTRAVAIAQAEKLGRRYDECNFIVAHLGGGMSINVHRKGRIVDLVSDDDGAMSPERAGKINTITLTKLAFSGKYRDAQELTGKLKGGSGLLDYLGTTDMRTIGKMIEEGNEDAAFIVGVMAYQISKDICSLAAVLEGNIDGIILTGGCSYSKYVTESVVRRVSFLAPVTVIPGAMEMEALARGVTRVLNGEEEAKNYSK